ncbi:MAG: DUF3592 domain-containing protein [Zoogloeaceae bacterium]|jgi:hypothetical protein|nr:DUF3592 domain-containing protein [Zoogloeaceae bacterium]
MRFLLPSPASLLSRLLLLLAALLLLAVGTVSVWRLALSPLLDAARSRHWVRVEARLQDLSLDYSPAQGARVLPVYRYRFAGQTVRGTRFGLHSWLDDADAQRAAYVDLLYRNKIRVWVNPRRPEESLIDRELHLSVMLMALPALAAALAGGALLWAAGVAARDAWRLRRARARRV